jgi:hypothetical protein
LLHPTGRAIVTGSQPPIKQNIRAGRSDAFTRVSDHVATLIGARAGAAVIPLRG